MTRSIAIIGAGLAGIAAARALIAAGLAPHLFDKGRAPGGRLATRRAEVDGAKLQWDHGAQYLRARGPGFAQALDDAGAAPWPDAERRVGVPGMSAVPRALAKGIPGSFGRHVGVISGEPGAWFLDHWDAAEAKPGAPLPASAPTRAGPFDAVLVTAPAPQAAELVGPIWPEAATRLDTIRYAPCWTVLASFAEQLPLPDTLRPKGDTIGWAARDSSKPGREAGAECWVIQAGPAFSRQHLEQPAAAVIPLLLAALASHSGAPLPAPRYAQAHRWRYSLLEQGLGAPCLWNPALRLGLAGDWCLEGRAEAAWDSGTAAAAALLA
ncbi:NAD(P)/FAD-dependent oxidoreductase [Plastoroseomonas arctica]|uniref:NAD(P)-binding protein n=1 Tax=Plastoroseomonas arctica TaxID=1509237 RepID=A0AAF1KHB2_9PROT|nr:NAD(P)-binding protein [Plastoroseomonas arctica]MBR0653744.1 NAD(P)-binding protein [Plastoroseomonas arctica]